jgi:superfamily II DNA or RNA helicase
MKILNIKQLDNDYRVEISVNRIRTYIPRETILKLEVNGEIMLFKVLKCDTEGKKIEAKKFTPCIYAWTTASYKLNNIYKVGLINWQSVVSRIKQTDTTGVLEKIELVEVFPLDIYDVTITRQIETTIHNRIGKVRKNREGVKGDWKTEIRPTIIQVIDEFKAKAQNTINLNQPVPRYYQYHASILAQDYFKTNNRGWIQWTCGSGKSFGGYWIFKSSIKIVNNLVVILVPNRQLVTQTHNDWVYIANTYGDKVKSIKIGGVENSVDDVEEIYRWLDNITSDTLNIVLSTYQSASKIADALRMKGIKADLTINDEVHRITGEDTKVWKRCLLDSYLPSRKRLSMTASPIEYTEASLGFSGMENEQLFGKCFHKYLTLDAIFDGYIAPLEIYGIESSSDTVEDVKQMINRNRNIIQRNLISSTLEGDTQIDFSEIEGEVNLDEGNPTFFIQLHNTLVALQQEIITHPVIYANTTKRIKMFMACLVAMAPQYNVKIDYFEVFTSKDKIDERIMKLETKFSQSKIAVAGNVYCLQEGISINSIDSVIMIDPRSSGPAIIQIIGRPVRLDKNNPNKVAKILIPVILEKNEDGKIIINNTYFKTTRDWMLAITGADEDFATLMIEDFRSFNVKSRQGIEVREVLPRNSRTSVSGRNRNLDRNPHQLEVVDFEHIKNSLKLATLITPSKTANTKRNSEDGKQIYLERQAITFILAHQSKIENYLNNYNVRQISNYSKVINTQENYIKNFSQINNINFNESKDILTKAGLANLVKASKTLQEKNIKESILAI